MLTASPCRPPLTWTSPLGSKDRPGSLGLAHSKSPNREPHLKIKHVIAATNNDFNGKLTDSKLERHLLGFDLDGLVVLGGLPQLGVLHDPEDVHGVDHHVGRTSDPRRRGGRVVAFTVTSWQWRAVHTGVLLQINEIM